MALSFGLLLSACDPEQPPRPAGDTGGTLNTGGTTSTSGGVTSTTGGLGTGGATTGGTASTTGGAATGGSATVILGEYGVVTTTEAASRI